MKEIPVYLFTGFLESGKTRFIQETMEDPRFSFEEPTLLLICEEGIEEYEPDRFVDSDVFFRVVEDEADLTPENLAAYQEECGAGRVVVEYNGMWMLDNFYQAMPEGWAVYQEFMFADATTFFNYNTNMRGLVVDKLKSCEFLAFNRYAPNIDKVELHKIVRAVSRRTEIVYEDLAGNVEYDDIEDPLPFDIEAPVIEVADENYAIWYRDLSEELEKYDKKTVRFTAKAKVRSELKNCFIVGRPLMNCCADDIIFAGLICNWKQVQNVKDESWVSVTAKIANKYHDAYGEKGPVLTAISVEAVEGPENEVATFY